MGVRQRDYLLQVDLTRETVDREAVPGQWLRQYLGGKGIGARYLYDRLEAGTDPLGPENVLLFMLGPLSGYLPGESRCAVVTKSPLTGTFLDSYSGGSFPEHLAGALPGCLGIVIHGRADSPFRLEVESGSARLQPANHWGEDTRETAMAFPDAAVACIGPAGESCVRYATVASDAGEHHAGRGGAGAVMGSKRLKAIVVRGDPPEPDGTLRDLRERYASAYADHDTGKWQAAGGTFESVDFAHEIGALATRGWQQGQFEEIADISVEAASEAASERESGTVPGDFRFETADGEVVLRGAAPMTLGAGLGVNHVDDVAELSGVCDRLGIDVIDAGNAVAWAIRAGERGLVDCPVEFGDTEGARALIEAIATSGDGTLDGNVSGDDERFEPELVGTLAEGVNSATRRFGGNEFIPTVKSMALPSYDPRNSLGMALAYATSDRGGCHRRARPIEEEAAIGGERTLSAQLRTVVGEQTVRSTLWCLILDDFVGETMWEDLGREWLAAVGRSYTTEELTQVGERVWTLVRLFNVREGFDRNSDILPEALHEAVPDGPRAGETLDPATFERALDAYYQARGWGPNGLPTQEALERLELDRVRDEETPLGEPWRT